MIAMPVAPGAGATNQFCDDPNEFAPASFTLQPTYHQPLQLQLHRTTSPLPSPPRVWLSPPVRAVIVALASMIILPGNAPGTGWAGVYERMTVNWAVRQFISAQLKYSTVNNSPHYRQSNCPSAVTAFMNSKIAPLGLLRVSPCIPRALFSVPK
ncbi:uncharacterized protein BP5553_01393 [Venustampulla echinocandica]|uniref:Uncharacterized protein n=1 Tax=Venustampulla echinocandica TaxID=2656787 RepID=A0A370U0W1_9HELO|nr:uncharacterized protein BP5553_01393 [Venustampulla echinocandica]RDL41414.1 hypothetical protein BP5553_01393 [Venustampulla echinocandica]